MSVLLLLLALLVTLPLTRSSAENAQNAAPPEDETILATQPANFDRITTLDGKTYERVSVQKVDPDGLLVEFSPRNGGFGTAKLKFRNLPPALRKQYAYDPARAQEFEASQAQGQKAWSAQNAAWLQRREAAEVEQAARAEKMREHAEANAALLLASDLRRAEADQSRRFQAEYYPGMWWGWGGYASASYGSSHGAHQHHVGIEPIQPASKFMGPMRPLGR